MSDLHADVSAPEPPCPWGPAGVFSRHEHLLTTHFAVIEGWLGLLEDGLLDDAARQRAAKVLRERTTTLRSDVCQFVSMIRQGDARDSS